MIYLKKAEMAITIERLMAENKELKEKITQMDKELVHNDWR